MAKKKSTHREKSTSQEPEANQQNQNPNPKMERSNSRPTAIEDSAEKLSSLKSLNAMLLKETVEKRQEVSALLESKKSLESELSRSASEIEALKAELAQMQELEVLRRENGELRREKEGVEERLEDVEREMDEVVRERDEMEKAKFEGDLEIGSMKKLENELRSEVKRGRDALNQAICENDALKQDLNAQIEERNKLREKLATMEAKYADELGELKSKYQVVSKELEASKNEIKMVKSELGSAGRNCEDLKREIKGLNEEKELMLREKMELSRERSEQDMRMNEVEKEVCQLNAIVLSLREDEEKWRVKFFEFEKINAEMVEKIEDMGRELNASMEKNKAKEKEIEGLMQEKLSALNSLAELETELDIVKLVKDEILKEKTGLETVKLKQENEIMELRHEVNELEGNIALLKESNRDELEKNRQLFSVIDGYKNMLDRLNMERDDVKRTLEEEKANGVKLQVKVSEISKKMEDTAQVIEELRATGDTLVGEKKELEKKHSKLVEVKGFAERKFADAQKKVDELEASLTLKTDMFEVALGMLRKTAHQLSIEKEKKGGEEVMKMVEKREMEPYLSELEAIKSAFRKREEKVGEMEKQMESLKWFLELTDVITDPRQN
ncbi:hypothetical protein Cgig2_032033 [Carnegiea gigantea]|uniref:Uncharacterized protein n=1 Tax=Carnegiea gigantea TaxID=171969 RepID=A0A9Q1K4R8_9CARY|nr:hypothetical protein Cgig2_032033 [Carnegiea gigantea]